ncbi:hypothetical protein [Actinoplanes teichomyceticus]|uniref:hypothetical protein n=1 Tax=Actinoplanes teichomyceticus TaxID=1867 RepID=UPI0019440CEA|nr:hypothetical protein [Actinoplanes teichomyceticus]
MLARTGLPAGPGAAGGPGGRTGRLVLVEVAAEDRAVVVRLVVRPGRPAAGLADPGFAGKRAGADRAALLLRRTQVVEPAGLLARHLDRLHRRLGAAPPEATALLAAALTGVVVGPIGTARFHGCSFPAASPLSSDRISSPSASGPAAAEPEPVAVPG